jgi:hypothetical protein
MAEEAIFFLEDNLDITCEDQKTTPECHCENPLKKSNFPLPRFPSHGDAEELDEYLTLLKTNINDIEQAISYSSLVAWIHQKQVTVCVDCWSRRHHYRRLLKQRNKNYRRMTAAIQLCKKSQTCEEQFSDPSQEDSESEEEVFTPKSL